ncbi:efflux RND transporter periplasmic adaptor subunit [Salinibacter altiplanensis]|uniref:efflux RND transporter periplasmic adaptor subunit n=1 Tax=Salinibacter altiplanensis TaxID=1803181 RepID=UPI000C9EC83C|nr:efflux RND transporter periplasmic adaptor subunit [Salinibacter altiplanensis]
MARLAFVGLTFLLLLSGCSSSSDGDSQRSRGQGNSSPPSVEAVQARGGTLPLQERMSGTVRARNQVTIYSELSEPVVAVEAQTGDYVEAGEPLVRLRRETYQQQVRQSKAALRNAKAEAQGAQAGLRELRSQLKRTERLADQDFESQQQLESLRAQVEQAKATYEQAQAQVEQAEATLEEQRTALRRTVVRAPVSGQVGQRNVEVGQRVGPETRLYTMGNLDSVEVRVEVTDRMFGRVRPGQTARIHVPRQDTVLTASVTRMSPFLNEASYSAEAVIEVPNESRLLNPGMFVEVDVAYGESERATIVPLSALYQDPASDARGVFVAPTLGTEIPVDMPDEFDEDNPPPLTPPTPTTFREVEVLAEGQQMAGINGVAPGDWVVAVGQNLLANDTGERVDARVRPLPWSRLLALQRLQDTDLLNRVLERQQRLAKQRFGDDSASDDSARSSVSSQDAPTDTTALDMTTSQRR